MRKAMKGRLMKDSWRMLVWGVFVVFFIVYFADFSLYEYAKGQGEAGLIYMLSFVVHIVFYPVLLCSLLVFLIIGAVGKRPLSPVLQVVVLIFIFDVAKVSAYNGDHPFYSIVIDSLAERYHRDQAEKDPPFSDTDIYNPDEHLSVARYLGDRPFIRNQTTTDELWRIFYGRPYLSLSYSLPRYVNISSRSFYYDRLFAYRLGGSTEFILFFYQNKLVQCTYFPGAVKLSLPVDADCVQSPEKQKQIILLETIAYCFQRNQSFQMIHKCSEKAKSLQLP